MLEALILGIVQGLTEFLPISSSGHLVLFDNILRVFFGEAFDSSLAQRLDFVVAVHVGTLVSVLIFFWRDVWEILKALPIFFKPNLWKVELEREPFKLGCSVLLITVITIAFALPLEFFGFLESAFESLMSVGIAFLAIGVFLFTTRFARARAVKASKLGAIVGIAQSLALLPGISRSGATIGAALLLGAERDFAAKLSFVAAIPAIIGAAIFEFLKNSVANVDWTVLAIGFLSSLLSGLFALKVLLRLIKYGQLYVFSYYLWIIGVFAIIFAIAKA